MLGGAEKGITWWCHETETFSALLALCAGNSAVTGEFFSQRPVTWSFGVFFDLTLNKWLTKQFICRWFEMPSCSLWRHCNERYMSQSGLNTESGKWQQLERINYGNCLKSFLKTFPKCVYFKSEIKWVISFVDDGQKPQFSVIFCPPDGQNGANATPK